MNHYVLVMCLGLMLVQSVAAEDSHGSTQQQENIAAVANAVSKPAALAGNEAKAAQPQSLESSYKREFAFLHNQKSELQNRLHTYKKQVESAEKELLQKIAALEQNNVALAGQDDAIRDELIKAEHSSDAVNDNTELLDMTYSQGNASLEAYQRSLEKNPEFSKAEHEQKLTMLFNQGVELIKELASIQHREGGFFLSDGAETKGTVVTIGNIAAYGVSEKASGILAPAGDGRLKLWPEPAAEVAKAIVEGKHIDLLKIFLFENKQKAIDLKQEKTVYSVIQSGGEIGWVIVALGGIALLLIIVRGLLLYFATQNTQLIAGNVIPLLAENEDEALAFCNRHNSPFARVLAATINNSHGNRDHMDDVISEALLHESGALNRFGSAILVIASVSPLLGLLGTVTGMISTFDIITEFGTGDPKLLSSGISIALVTTELGLIVAIPAVLAGTLLGSWSESIKYNLEEIALRASNILLDRDDLQKTVQVQSEHSVSTVEQLTDTFAAAAYQVS